MALLVMLRLGALLGAAAATAPPSTLLPLLLLAPSVPADPQSAFSPFSLLGSFFSSSPPWAKVAPTPRRKPQKVFFRPHHPLPPKGPTFSASQQVPQIVRLQQRPTPKHSPQPRTPSPPRPPPPSPPRHPPPRRRPLPLSPISPTQIIRITSPSNFSSHPLPSTTPAPTPPAQTTRAALQGIVSNSVDNGFLTNPEQVELVYPSNSVVPNTAPPVTEQSAFSSFPSRESELSGPNPEDFPIISLIDQGPGRHYYDEVFHLGVRAPPAPQPSPVVLGLQPFGAYYSQEEFAYNQDPIDLELVHGSGPRARDVLGAGGGTFVNNEIGDTVGEFRLVGREAGGYTEALADESDTTATTQAVSTTAAVRLETIPSPAPLVASTTTLRETTAASTQPVPSPFPTSTAPPFTVAATIVDLPDPTAASSTSYSSFTSSFASFASNPSLASIPSTLSTFTAFSPPVAPPASPGLPSPRSRPQSGDFSPDFTTLQSGAEARRVRLVNTIEYRPEEEARSRTGRTDVRSNSSTTIVTVGLGVGAQLAECGAGAEAGWCPVSAAYPALRAVEVQTGCPAVLEAYRAVVSEDLDLLGDNSPSVISSERDRQRPWSWKVYAYKKQQVCSSELHFTQPGLALDTEGVWRVILQTESLRQRVALDMCHAPDSPCPGVADCGRKSRCVQRYNYQMLLSLAEGSPCPSLRAFRLPAGCVCHAETQGDQQGDQGFFF